MRVLVCGRREYDHLVGVVLDVMRIRKRFSTLIEGRARGPALDLIAGRLLAAQELDRTQAHRVDTKVLAAVCGQGRALTEMPPHKRDRLTMADNLRADLGDLAVIWGNTGPPLQGRLTQQVSFRVRNILLDVVTDAALSVSRQSSDAYGAFSVTRAARSESFVAQAL